MAGNSRLPSLQGPLSVGLCGPGMRTGGGMSAHICVPILSHHSLVTWPGAHLSRIDLLHNRLVISKVGPQLPCVLTSGSFHDRSGLLEILAPLTIGSQSLTAHSSHPGHSLLASFAAALLPSHMTNCPRAQSSALSALLSPNPRGDFIVSEISNGATN